MNDDYWWEQRAEAIEHQIKWEQRVATQRLLVNGKPATAQQRADFWKHVRRNAIRDYLGRIEALTDDPVLLSRVAEVRQALDPDARSRDAVEGMEKWGDLFGIDPDYCDGKPVDEWLDENRGWKP